MDEIDILKAGLLLHKAEIEQQNEVIEELQKDVMYYATEANELQARLRTALNNLEHYEDLWGKL